MSLGKPRSGGNNHGGNNRDRDGPRNFDRDRNKEGTVKLHVAGVGMNPDTEKIKQIFGNLPLFSSMKTIEFRGVWKSLRSALDSKPRHCFRPYRRESSGTRDDWSQRKRL